MRLAAIIAGWLGVVSGLVWLAHENHLLVGSIPPGLGLLAAGIALARRRGGLGRVVAILISCAAWGALSQGLFAHRDRELLAGWSELLREVPSAPATGVNVVVVAADALRRDHLSLYGYDRPTSPELDRFATDALVFERAFAQAPSTKPAIASLFTSRFPSQHRAIDNEDALDPALPTLAELLARAGYRTGAFIENPIIGSEFGYQRGFDDWVQDKRRHRKRPRAGERMQDLDGAIALWLRRHRHDSFFLYIHYIDPHTPYDAPPPHRGQFGGKPDTRLPKVGDLPRGDEGAARASYDEEIRFVDQRFGRLIDELRGLALLDATAVVFLSDHGEGFGEHGYIHHSRSVYSDLIDIPLVIRFPTRFAPGRSDRLTQHVDLAPTILELVGLGTAAPGFEGQSLLAPVDTEHSLFIEHLRGGWGARQRAVVRGRHKLVQDLETNRLALFDIGSDPQDRNDLLPQADPKLVRDLAARLDAHTASATGPRAPRVSLPDDTRSALEALGYLH